MEYRSFFSSIDLSPWYNWFFKVPKFQEETAHFFLKSQKLSKINAFAIFLKYNTWEKITVDILGKQCVRLVWLVRKEV